MIIQRLTDWMRGDARSLNDGDTTTLKNALRDLEDAEVEYEISHGVQDITEFKEQFLIESEKMRIMGDEIRKSELELHASKIRFEHIFNSLNEAVFICDFHGFILESNEKFKSIFNKTGLSQLNYYDLFPNAIDQWRYMQRNTMAGVIVSFDENTKTPVDGLYLLSSSPLNDREIVVILTDLTDLGEAKALTIRRQKMIDAIECISGYITSYSWENIIEKTLVKLQDVTGYSIACFIRMSDANNSQKIKIIHYAKADGCDYKIEDLNRSLENPDILNMIEQVRTECSARTRTTKLKCPIKSDLIPEYHMGVLRKLGINRFISQPVVIKNKRYGSICLMDIRGGSTTFDSIIEEDISQIMNVVACLLGTYITTAKTLIKLSEKEESVDSLFVDYKEYVFRFNMAFMVTFSRQYNDKFFKYDGSESVGRPIYECLLSDDPEYITKLKNITNQLSESNRTATLEHAVVAHYGEYDMTERHIQLVRAVYTQGGEEFVEYQVTGLVDRESINGLVV